MANENTNDRYVFLRTGVREGTPVALIADEMVLGTSGITSLRQAFAAHAAPVIKAGVMSLTVDELKERIPALRQQGLSKSIAAFERALGCVEKKIGIPADAVPHKAPKQIM